MNAKLPMVLIVALAFIITGCERQVTMETVVMGTIPCRITVAAAEMSQRQISRAIEGAFAVINDVNDLMSTYVASSEISRLNLSKPDEMVELSPMTFEVLAESIRYGRVTGGAFDVTVMPLVELWGFYPIKRGVVPKDEEIEETLGRIGFWKIVLDQAERKAGFKVAGMKVDLGGIAKGYAVDKAVEVLKKRGVQNGLVEIGGEVAAFGRSKTGEIWRVGVQHPDKSLDRILTVIELSGGAVATSGDYQNFFEIGGVRYSHIIDPDSGRPVQNGICSVTVVAPTCTEADVAATAISVMGVERGMKLLESRPELEGIIIERMADDELNIHTSAGLKHLEFAR